MAEFGRREGRFEGEGGLEIFWRSWLPAGPARATVLLSHGVSEHSGRYDHVGGPLAAAGYAVYALDHRGHGRSQGSRAVVDRFDNAVEDLHRLAEMAADEQAGTKAFLLGHSMGGAVALAYSFRYQDELAGLLLSGPAVALESVSRLELLAAAALSRLAPRLGVYPVDADAVSRDPEVVRVYEQDPLNFHKRIPARTMAETAAVARRCTEEVPGLRLPLLVMYGTADTIVDPSAALMVHRLAASTDKTLIPYEGLYHEILNEPEQGDVLSDIVAWLDERA